MGGRGKNKKRLQNVIYAFSIGTMKLERREQFIVSPAGRKMGVVLDLASYRQLMEDFHDLKVIAERKSNPKFSAAQFLPRLKKHGRI